MVERREDRSSMHAIFRIIVEGSDPYAVARAAVRAVVFAPLAAHRSNNVLITVVRLRWTSPSSCGIMASIASSKSSFERRFKIRIVGYEEISFRERAPRRDLKVLRYRDLKSLPGAKVQIVSRRREPIAS